MHYILGIETSCDETAAAIVASDKTIIANQLFSQIDEHKLFGGVVPEIASRAHMLTLEKLIEKCLEESKLEFNDISAIAATGGPGLIGGVLVGAMMAKAIAFAANKPFIAVNHLAGHALSPKLAADIDFPYLLLLISGGHCQFVAVESPIKFTKLGGTIDDALGEAFDKVAKMLGLGYPGGPKLEQRALNGDETRFKFPEPLIHDKSCNFSFSGLKTAVKREIEKMGQLSEQDINDICASFQATCARVIISRIKQALRSYNQLHPDSKRFVIAGGVAANKYLAEQIRTLLQQNEFEFFVPPLSLCTDNAAMIAYAGLELYNLGIINTLDFEPRARWELSSFL